MKLVDRLRLLAAADPRGDLLEFLGVGRGEFQIDQDTITVGDETISLADAKAAIFGPIDVRQGKLRVVEITDL